MTHQYSIEQAQSRLGEIVETVNGGTPAELIQAGQRVAVVISIEEYDRLSAVQQPNFWQSLQTFRQQFDFEKLKFGDDVFANVRDASPGREIEL